MPLDLEEQEQVDELKAWWNQWGTLVLSVVLAAALAFAGLQAWRWYQREQAAQAAALYEALARAVQANDAKAVRNAGGTLAESYGRTLYASMGALLSARYYFDKGDLKNAKAQLQWVLERSGSDDFRDLARLRLGAILLDEKAFDEALKLADAKHAAAYDAQYAALKGDVLAAKKQPADAKAAYQAALDKAGREDSAFRESVRMRLEALGA
ncbi:MAG: tetratricopeptide repeat protein [Betaproteobacteria bacterium]|nr:tetratricopeptide repeat protein [Betaproteobacteria bacterium]